MNPDKNHETEMNNLHELVVRRQRENQQLKKLLEQAGIDYSSCIEDNANAVSVPDQGKRILPFAITENAARHFFARFWGRYHQAKADIHQSHQKHPPFPLSGVP